MEALVLEFNQTTVEVAGRLFLLKEHTGAETKAYLNSEAQVAGQALKALGLVNDNQELGADDLQRLSDETALRSCAMIAGLLIPAKKDLLNNTVEDPEQPRPTAEWIEANCSVRMRKAIQKAQHDLDGLNDEASGDPGFFLQLLAARRIYSGLLNGTESA